MKTVLVTGADGMLGSNVVRELLTRDFHVRVLLQRERQAKTLEGLELTRFYGDLLDAESVDRAVEGCDAVIHAAASTSVWPSRSAIVKRINVEGTRHVIEAVRRHGVRRLVYVGSASSFGFGTKVKPGSEQTPVSAQYGLDYIDSKREAQELVLAAAREGLPCVVVNPTYMFGPFDSTPSSAKMILAIYGKKLPGHTSGGRNFVCTKDVATAAVNALFKGRLGECYILGNRNMTYKEAFSVIASVTGVSAPRMRMNSLAVCAFGWLSERIAVLFNRKPTVSYPMARISCDSQYYTSAKAIAELEMPQTPIETGIRDAFEWLNNNGYLDKYNLDQKQGYQIIFRRKLEGLLRLSKVRSM